jgi:hypothetical protein
VSGFERPKSTAGDLARGTAVLGQFGGTGGATSNYINSGGLGSEYANSGGIGLGDIGTADDFSGVTPQALSSAGLYAGSGVASGAASSGSSLLGSSVTINPAGGASTAVAGALGGTQGTPGLGGAFGGGAPVDITDLPGTTSAINTAGGDITKGSSSIQSGAQNAATGIAGTIASTVNSIETFTSNAFVVVALVAVGALFLAFGLGMFGKRAGLPIPNIADALPTSRLREAL